MITENFRKIGKIKDSHGIKGEVYILIFSKDTSWMTQNIQISLLLNNHEKKTYSLTKVRPYKDGAVVSLENVNTRNDSDLLVGAEVWVDKNYFTSKNAQPLFLVEIENFKIIDKVLGPVGVITGFSSNGVQDLLVVEDDKNNIYEIPFVKEFVIDIQFDQKTILTDLPEGLLSINNLEVNQDDGHNED